MIRILSIGNSYSQDAQKWLHQICASVGEEVEAVNLYIGGCSLERHWNEYEHAPDGYRLEINGEPIRQVTLREGLAMGPWDIITLQQASIHSGKPQSYLPWLPRLAQVVRQAWPEAKLYIHETWAYEHGRDCDWFRSNYGANQRNMYDRLHDAYEMASRLVDAPVIPVGTVIQYLREHCPEFDVNRGGISLNAPDRTHLSATYGRYAAALTWCGYLLGRDVRQVTFKPFHEEETVEEKLLEVIREGVYGVLNPQTL